MTKQLSDEKFSKYVELVNGMIEGMPEPRRSALKKMMGGNVGRSYFTSPASSREEYHSCYAGGLMVHSLNVVKCLKDISDALCPGKYDKNVVRFVALFHDLGKTGDGEEEYYVPNPSDWHRGKGMLYDTNKKCVFMPHQERSLYILQNHGIEMTSEEYLAIRLHDGMYEESNKQYKMKEPELALLLHWADMWSVKLEKSQSRGD